MWKNGRKRAGFTLPEVLVTVAIVAVLASVVVPAVTQQLGKGDAPAFTSTVNGLRTAITSFVSDVRKFPGELSQLSVDIATSDEDLAATADGGVAYTSNVVDRWRGPYESSATSTGIISFSYGWVSGDDLVDSLNHIVITLTKTGAVIADATELDVAVDNGNGKDAGIIRWAEGVAPALDDPNTVKIFLMSSAR
jgi:prepilin-type N-terminal cleavage/methylation domain-containing protein